MTVGNKVSKKRVMLLVKEINRSKEDVIEYLSSLGLDKVTLNTTLEPETVSKVYNHFKRDLEEQEKHKKKVLDFSLKNKIEMSEAEEQKRKQEELKRKKEEEDRIKKVLEEKAKAEEEEKRKQELLAMLEREKLLKEQERKEKEAKAQLEKILDEKKKKAAAKAKAEKETVIPEEPKDKKIAEEIQKPEKTEKVITEEPKPVPVFAAAAEPEKPKAETEAKAKIPETVKSDIPRDQSGAHLKSEIPSKPIISPFNKPIAPIHPSAKKKTEEPR